jgi:hypothetical protein
LLSDYPLSVAHFRGALALFGLGRVSQDQMEAHLRYIREAHINTEPHQRACEEFYSGSMKQPKINFALADCACTHCDLPIFHDSQDGLCDFCDSCVLCELCIRHECRRDDSENSDWGADDHGDDDDDDDDNDPAETKVHADYEHEEFPPPPLWFFRNDNDDGTMIKDKPDEKAEMAKGDRTGEGDGNHNGWPILDSGASSHMARNAQPCV